jgi:hypothetical protein
MGRGCYGDAQVGMLHLIASLCPLLKTNKQTNKSPYGMEGKHVFLPEEEEEPRIQIQQLNTTELNNLKLLWS